MSAPDDNLLRELLTTRAESLVLQAVAASLLAEIAVMHKDPQAKLGQMISGLLGAAEGISRGIDEPIVTKVIERISSMAEAITPSSKGL